MSYSPAIKAVVSANNSTSTPLGISGVFTGTSDDVLQYSEITVTYNTDEPAVEQGFEMQTSIDGVNWDTQLKLTPGAVGSNFSGAHTLVVISRYFRIVYTNGLTAQTHFRLATIYHPSKSKDLTSRSQQVLSKVNDVALVRDVTDHRLDRNKGLIGFETQERKFGVNEAVGNGAFEDVVIAGGKMTLPTSAETIQVRSGGNVNDDVGGTGAITVRVYFLDSNWEEVEEVLTLAGASASSASSATCIRLNKIEIETVGTYGGANTGIVIIEQSTSTIEMGRVAAEAGVSQQCVFSVPANKTVYITGYRVSVGQNNSADVRLWHIEHGDDISAPFTSVKHIEFTIEDFSGTGTSDLDTFLKFDEKNTIGTEAIRITGSGDARVGFEFDFLLVNNLGS